MLFIPYFENNHYNNDRKAQIYNSHFYEPALNSSYRNLIKILFLLKLHQISSLYKYLEEMLYVDEFYEGFLSLMRLFFQVLLISHFIACAWHYSALLEKAKGSVCWLDVSLYGSQTQHIHWSRGYLYSWYWSLATMITVGYGDISPKNDTEIVIASVAMLFGCGFFAYAISSIGVIVERFSMKKKNLK